MGTDVAASGGAPLFLLLTWENSTVPRQKKKPPVKEALYIIRHLLPHQQAGGDPRYFYCSFGRIGQVIATNNRALAKQLDWISMRAVAGAFFVNVPEDVIEYGNPGARLNAISVAAFELCTTHNNEALICKYAYSSDLVYLQFLCYYIFILNKTKMSEVPTQQPYPIEQHAAWPDGAPAVSVDIEAGQHYTQVDIDPHGLTSLLDTMGAAPNQIASAKYNFNFQDRNTGGKYNLPTKTVKINLDPHDKININSSIIHESTHYLDHSNGEKKDGASTHSKLSVAAGVGTVALGLFTAGKFGLHIEKTVSVASVVEGGTLGYLADSARYYFNAGERRARKNEKNTSFNAALTNTINLQKSSNS